MRRADERIGARKRRLRCLGWEAEGLWSIYTVILETATERWDGVRLGAFGRTVKDSGRLELGTTLKF